MSIEVNSASLLLTPWWPVVYVANTMFLITLIRARGVKCFSFISSGIGSTLVVTTIVDLLSVGAVSSSFVKLKIFDSLLFTGFDTGVTVP